MKTYYEKRSVEKDGMPKEDGHYIVIISDDKGMWLATTDMPFRGGKFYFRGGKFYGLDPKSVSHYLVPVSERAVEERAIAEWDIDFHVHFKARLHLENGQLSVIAAMNGYGDGEDVSKIIVSPLSATTK